MLTRRNLFLFYMLIQTRRELGDLSDQPFSWTFHKFVRLLHIEELQDASVFSSILLCIEFRSQGNGKRKSSKGIFFLFMIFFFCKGILALASYVFLGMKHDYTSLSFGYFIYVRIPLYFLFTRERDEEEPTEQRKTPGTRFCLHDTIDRSDDLILQKRNT